MAIYFANQLNSDTTKAIIETPVLLGTLRNTLNPLNGYLASKRIESIED